jgi:hypothetical protein
MPKKVTIERGKPQEEVHMSEEVQRPTIGRIVHYRQEYDVVAAIVTMTPEEWSPGYRDNDGEWHPTTNVPQPKAGTVHLHLFPPFGAGWTAEQCDVRDVAHGDEPGSWSWATEDRG